MSVYLIHTQKSLVTANLGHLHTSSTVYQNSALIMWCSFNIPHGPPPPTKPTAKNTSNWDKYIIY